MREEKRFQEQKDVKLKLVDTSGYPFMCQQLTCLFKLQS
jgi:hypothetical protein